jgi:hypothetical protein
MKFSIRSFTIIIVLVIFSIIPKKLSSQGANVSFEIFYNNLSPYGQWVNYPGYDYVWVPDVGQDFIPYSTGGRWVWSDYGWTWVSDFNWGWAPFHYGRWDYDNYYGWFWVPGNEWGPAWVSWRRCPGYYGWAPLGPNIYIDAVYSGNYVIPNDRWVFVPEKYLCRTDIHNYYYGPRKDNSTYINNSTLINNTYVDKSRNSTYVTGPRKEDVQKITGEPIRQVAIRENQKPGEALDNNELRVYRPSVIKRENVRPSRIAERKDIKPISERKETTRPDDTRTEQERNNTPPPTPANSGRIQGDDRQKQPDQRNNQPNRNQQQNNNPPTTPVNPDPLQKDGHRDQPRNNEPNRSNVPKEDNNRNVNPEQKIDDQKKVEPKREARPEEKRNRNNPPPEVKPPPQNRQNVPNNDRVEPVPSSPEKERHQEVPRNDRAQPPPVPNRQPEQPPQQQPRQRPHE